MHPRENIITPAVVDTLLQKYKVPEEKKPMMNDIISLYLCHADSPKVFARKAREYTEQHNISPTDARAALIIFTQVRDDIQSILTQKANEN